VILIVAFQMEQHHSAPSCQRGDLNTPLHSSTTDAQREGELTELNGKLYTIAKPQSHKSCPAVADASLRLCGRFARSTSFVIGECVPHNFGPPAWEVESRPYEIV